MPHINLKDLEEIEYVYVIDGVPIGKIIEERDLLLAFVRRVKSSSCNEIPEMCLACDALELLVKIGK